MNIGVSKLCFGTPKLLKKSYSLKLIRMKSERIHIRITKETKSILLVKSKNHKTTLSNYITSLILNKKIKVQALPDNYALKLKTELTIIGKNLWTTINREKVESVSDKLKLELTIIELKKASESITNYYDRKNSYGK